MKQLWEIVQKSDRRFFARSQRGRLVGFMTRDGLIGFLSSRGVPKPAISGTLDNLESQNKPFFVRMELEDGWH